MDTVTLRQYVANRGHEARVCPIPTFLLYYIRRELNRHRFMFPVYNRVGCTQPLHASQQLTKQKSAPDWNKMGLKAACASGNTKCFYLFFLLSLIFLISVFSGIVDFFFLVVVLRAVLGGLSWHDQRRYSCRAVWGISELRGAADLLSELMHHASINVSAPQRGARPARRYRGPARPLTHPLKALKSSRELMRGPKR